MKYPLGFLLVVGVVPLLASCGVPRLYAPPTMGAHRMDHPPARPQDNLAPTVADIISEIACELGDAETHQLNGAAYNIQVLLTLEVDDNLDLTPSINLINPLAVAGETETNTLSADLGGARKRSFTTTYYLDSQKLHETCGAGRDEARHYTLSGRLDLFEIARDGAGALARADGQRPADPKLIPTFGSTIQFTVTKQLTALGPLWTLKRFKGPSGSNGLINGRRLDIDTAVFVFTPRAAPLPTSRQLQAASDLAAKARHVADAHQDRARAETRVADATAETKRRQAQLRQVKSRNGPALQSLTQSVTDAVEAETFAERQLTLASDEERRAEAALRDAEAEKRTADTVAVEQDSEATRLAGQSQLQAILLQNATLLSR